MTVADIDPSAFGGKSGALKALAVCPLNWHMRNANATKTGGEVLEQWDVSGWGKQYVIKVKSSEILDAYAECLIQKVQNVTNMKGPTYSGTPWHVTLYGENQTEAQKSFEAYTADSPRLDWFAYYLNASDSPQNGLPGSDYHLTKV